MNTHFVTVEVKPRLRCPTCGQMVSEAIARRIVAEGLTRKVLQCPHCHAFLYASVPKPR